MCHRGVVVKELLVRADKLGSTPVDAVFCSCTVLFFLFGPFFNTVFPFGLFFFILTADPAGHELGSIYIFIYIFGKGISKLKLSICILARLYTTR